MSMRTMCRRTVGMFGAVGLALALCACILQSVRAMQPGQGDALLFDDGLDPAFQSWSFDAAVDFAASSPTYGGSARAIAVTYQPGNWGALWLVRPGGDIDLDPGREFARRAHRCAGEAEHGRRGAEIDIEVFRIERIFSRRFSCSLGQSSGLRGSTCRTARIPPAISRPLVSGISKLMITAAIASGTTKK